MRSCGLLSAVKELGGRDVGELFEDVGDSGEEVELLVLEVVDVREGDADGLAEGGEVGGERRFGGLCGGVVVVVSWIKGVLLFAFVLLH